VGERASGSYVRNMDEVLRLRITAGSEAPARARAALKAQPEVAGVEDSVALLVSELVTNSVQHAGADSVEVNLYTGPEGVRVEVIDRGAGFDAFATPAPEHRRFGLYLVDKLADSWGVDTGAATRIWFELAKA
jgi:anti-sigma regulatory factor (Ser/Thr protein kinase)